MPLIIPPDVNALSLAEVKALIQAEGYGTDTTLQQTLMVQAVLRRLYGMRRWRFLQSTSIDEFSFTVANAGIADLNTLGRGLRFDSVRWYNGTDYYGDGENDELEDIVVRNLRFTERDPGVPRKWARVGDSIYSWPIPDKTYPLEVVWTGLTLLPTIDDAVIYWPETHIDVVIYGVIMRLCRRQRDWNGLDRARQDFNDALREMLADEGQTSRQKTDQVERWSGWDKLA